LVSQSYNDFYGGTVRQSWVRGAKVRRSNIELAADILRSGGQGAGKTKIMYDANMSYHQLQKYLDLLVNRGCLKRNVIDKSRIRYSVTKRGSMLLKSIDNVLEALDRRAASKLQK
jgi:predicted transcriptional regulator